MSRNLWITFLALASFVMTTGRVGDLGGALANWDEPVDPTLVPLISSPGRYRPLAPLSGERFWPEGGLVSDTYGYTRSEPAQSWISADGTREAAFSNLNRGYSAAIELGFQFPFYENSYSKLYVNVDGFITFEKGMIPLENEIIPQDTSPNNLLAVFWEDLSLELGVCPGGAKKVYYSYGTAGSEKYTLVEWRQVCHKGSGSSLTFEAILYEKGDIRFQYHTLPGGLSGATVGIENSSGTDGLCYQYNTPGVAAGGALLFTRPAPGGRGLITPTYNSSFTAGGRAELAFQVRNTGNLAGGQADTYDLIVEPVETSGSNWGISFSSASTGSALVDTNGNRILDTGPLNQGQALDLLLRLSAPAGSKVGDIVKILVKARSSLDSSRTASALFQASVPAKFAQAFSNDESGLRMSLITSSRSNELEAGNEWFSGNTLALASTPEGSNMYAWEQSYQGQNNLGHNLGFAILSPSGKILLWPQDLTPPHPSGVYDYNPVLTAAPDGTVGALWLRGEDKNGKELTNLFFAVLNSQGAYVIGPFSVTNNITPRGPDDKDVPKFYSPKLAALGNGKFVLAWIDQRLHTGGETSNIDYAVYSAGNFTKGSLASSLPGGIQYIDPALASLEGDRFLAAYSEYDRGSQVYTVAYQVMNPDGQILKGRTPLGGNGSGTDAVQLEGGNILLAWTGQANSAISFTVLNGQNYTQLSPPVELANPNPRLGDYVSVTADKQGNGILTWMDYVWNDYLYYSLVDGQGNILTPPMHFYQGESFDPIILTSFTGQGNAPYNPTWKSFLPLLRR